MKDAVNFKYIAILDVDQQPKKNFLTTLLPLLENEKRIGLVQVPQLFRNNRNTLISYLYSAMQSIFFDAISNSRSNLNFSTCFGTNCILRYDVLKQICFFDEECIIEDTATSIKIHLLGYNIKYLDFHLVTGIAPQSIKSLLIQIKRYTIGNNQLFLSIMKNICLGRYESSHFYLLSNYLHCCSSLLINSLVFYISILFFLLSIKSYCFYLEIVLIVAFIFIVSFIINPFRLICGMILFSFLLPLFLIYSFDIKSYSPRFIITPK